LENDAVKILQVVDDFPPYIAGDGIHVRQISKELSKRDHDVTVLTTVKSLSNSYVHTEKNRSAQAQEANMNSAGEQERTGGVRVRRFRRLFQFSYFSFSLKLCTTILNGNFDLIHIHRYFSLQACPAMYISKLKGKPIIFTPHSATTREQKSILATLLKKTFDCTFGRYLIRSPNMLIALTQDNIRDYLELGAKADRIRLVPNGIDLKKFRHLPDPSRFLTKHEITDEVVLFVGRLVRYKGVHHLLQIAPKILAEFPKTKFVIVGPDYGYKNELLKLVKTLGLQKSVVFTGAISDSELLEAYAAADVLAFPSIHEGFGLVLLEAMACRKPIVTWKTSAMQYVVENQKSGILVSPWNLGDFAKSIVLLLSDKKLAKDMGEKGRKTVEGKFEWKSVVDSLEEIYEEAIAR